MIKHYLKIAFRSLRQQKILTLINILGLSTGLACFTLFLLYAVNEFSYDSFHTNASNIYRVYVWSAAKPGEDARGDIYEPMPLGPTMKKDIPDVINAMRLREGWGMQFVRIENKVTREEMNFADPEIFSMFSFRLKTGDPATALKDLHSVVLTEETAEKLFGKTEPIGKTVEVKLDDDFVPFTVTAIAENIPNNSTIRFKMLGNFNYLATTPSGIKRAINWHASSYQTWVQLKPGSTLPSERDRLIAFRKRYYPDEEEKSRKAGWTGKGPRIWFGLQPLRAMHTDTLITGGVVTPIDPKTIWILLSIAAGVLLIACINFTTLAIGRSAGRSKEVGVRKVIGGSKRSLIFQFLAEALLLTVFSGVLGMLMVELLLPWFNSLSGSSMQFSFLQYPQLWWLLAGLIFLTGLLAGSYPALVLSGFNPIEVLKTKIRLGGSNFFTKSLVTLQFVMSAGLIISTVIIMQQLRYMRSKYPGFNKENVVVIDADGTDTKKVYPIFRQMLASSRAVLGTTSAELSMGEGAGWSRSGFDYEGKQKYVFEYFVDPDYLKVMGMNLLTGRNFDPANKADTATSVIINETMARDFGWNNNTAIGQQLKGYNEKSIPVVIGVVKDFNYLGFTEQILPQMFHQFSYYKPAVFLARIQPGEPAKALADLQKAWNSVAPGFPLKYSFLDDDLNRFYKSEARWSNIVGWAGGISIFLACLGLLGLAALSSINRTKEIGIRKVLGASLTAIISILSRDFIRLVIIALIIASPLAWWLMSKWLQGYPYRIKIEWWVFACTGAATIIIALATVSFNAIKAALANPVKSLRSE